MKRATIKWAMHYVLWILMTLQKGSILMAALLKTLNSIRGLGLLLGLCAQL